MSTQYPPLPHRRLKMMANGIWDEANKAFYPYRPSNTTLPAKSGIRYFIKSIYCTGTNTGDAAVNYVGYAATINGSSIYFIAVVPVTTAASGVSSIGIVNIEPCVLSDANRQINVHGAATTAYYNIVYAEIPDDLGWVVIE